MQFLEKATPFVCCVDCACQPVTVDLIIVAHFISFGVQFEFSSKNKNKNKKNLYFYCFVHLKNNDLPLLPGSFIIGSRKLYNGTSNPDYFPIDILKNLL